MPTRLELTWIGKDVRPNLEPRILMEDAAKSYHAPSRVSDADIFDNRLIHGDNLLALKALEQEFTGKVKCIYIDPPFNTQQAFEYYDDGVEHSLWLSLLHQRLKILHTLLHVTGTLFVHIDDNELAYLTCLIDEIFGRKNRSSIITFKQGAATGHKAINPGVVTTSNFILVYAKDKSQWTPNRVFSSKTERDKRYNQFIINVDDGYKEWKFITLLQAFAETHNKPISKVKKDLGNEYENNLLDFVLKHSKSVVRRARPDYNAVGEEARQLINISNNKKNEIYFLERQTYSNMYFIGGERILFYADKLREVDGELVAGEPLTTIWDDLLSNNLHNEGHVDFPKSKKPESLIKRCLELATNPGDLVLDSFLGSGTTAAVAHKMGRRWIGIELGEHCTTHCLPRLKKVVNCEDTSGITAAVNWQGGGGFRFYELGPTLIKEDKWGNPIINPQFNPEMLAQAVCKIAGFTYAPDSETFWMHGKGTEADFIYVTTQHLDAATLAALNDEVGPDRSLLVFCYAFDNTCKFPQLTVKKIPQTVLDLCDWNHDDYSLEIKNLPVAQPLGEKLEPKAEPASTLKKRGKKLFDQGSLFDTAPNAEKEQA